MRLGSDMLRSLCILFFSAVLLCWLAASSPLNATLGAGSSLLAVPTQVEARAANGNQTLDACSLLTGDEITNVLGEPLQGLKPSTQATGNINMSQCLFVTRNFAKSASLAVATSRGGESGARSLRAFWRSQFHSPPHPQEEEKRPASIKTPLKSAFHEGSEGRESSGASQSESEAEEGAGKPRAISGLGEEAYWVGSRLAGALYVLQGDLFLRISVGGVPQESTRITKSKSLATAVLPRLNSHRN